MELMNEKATITGGIPKIVETPNHFIMNSQLYEKQTLKPLPMKFSLPMPTGYNDIVLNTSVQDILLTHADGNCLHRQCQRIGNYRNIIRDKFDPNVFFEITKWNSYDSTVIARIRWYENEGYVVEKQLVSNGFGNTEWTAKADFKILYETENEFVFEYHGDRYGHYLEHGYTCYTLGKLNKKTLTPTYYLTNNRNYANQTYLLEQFNDVGYVLRQSYGDWLVYKINTSANTLQQIGTTINIQDGGRYIGSNPIKIGDYYYFLTQHYDSTSNYRKYIFLKMKLNTNTDTFEYEFVEILNYLNFEMDSTGAGNMSFSGSYSTSLWHQIQTFTVNDVIYFSCTIYSSPSSVWTPLQHKHVLLKLTNNGFEILHLERFTDGCKGVLFVNDDYQKPVFVTTNSCLFYTFDESSETMINTHKIGGVFKVVGFDTLGRFIMMHKDNTVDILTDTNASTLLADFDQELYNKDNTSEIDTTVSFYAKNFLDEFLETSVTLTLSGPVVFKENGEKTLKISTLKTGVRTVPVVITGYGSIEVIITQNT